MRILFQFYEWKLALSGLFQLCIILYSILVVKLPKITSQPQSHKDVDPGKAVAFLIQTTGTQPLSYQWQWKQFGKEHEQGGWQNLSGENSSCQEAELMLTGVKACSAGYYRCKVSNSAGRETSQCASLTVGKLVHYS